MTADLARGILAGLAIAFLITAGILIFRPVQSPAQVFVPRTFSPAPAHTPHCTAATAGPVPLQVRRCAP